MIRHPQSQFANRTALSKAKPENPDVVVRAPSADALFEFLRDLERGFTNGWARDRTEERNPRNAMPAGSVVLRCPNAPGRPNARVILAPEGDATLRTFTYGPSEVNWFLPDWGFDLQANRDMVQALLSARALMDLMAHLLRAAQATGAAVSIEPQKK